LRLARKSKVYAAEGDAGALAAFDRAYRHATGLKRVTGERRDLFRRPLGFKELDQFDGRAADVQTDYTFFRAGEEHGVFKLP
jgi:23S rRNA (uracil1939-C5)-methyltransferase